MSDRSGIEWTDATWNPVTGCAKVSPGCDNCYAETFAERWRGVAGHHYEQGFDLRLWPERLVQPARWKAPRRIFVNSMSDLFHPAVPSSFVALVLEAMAATPQHVFQVLTKRPGRMASVLRQLQPQPLPHVWWGTSIEDDHYAWRADRLRTAWACCRWVVWRNLPALRCSAVTLKFSSTSVANPRPRGRASTRPTRSSNGMGWPNGSMNRNNG